MEQQVDEPGETEGKGPLTYKSVYMYTVQLKTLSPCPPKDQVIGTLWLTSIDIDVN